MAKGKRLDRRNLVIITVMFGRGKVGNRIAEYLGPSEHKRKDGQPCALLSVWNGREQKWITSPRGVVSRLHIPASRIVGRPGKGDSRMDDLKRLHSVVLDEKATEPTALTEGNR